MKMDRYWAKRWGRWVATFAGFPLSGVAARLVVGDIDSTGAAIVGGLIGGAVLGAAQATIGGIDRANWLRWIGATALGFGVGLGVAATAVGFDTDTASLVTMGAISGLAVGLAQAASIPMRASDRIAWAAATPALWSLGWLITAQVIVDAERQHSVFGSSGALTVSLIAGGLFASRQAVSASMGESASFGPAVAR